MFWFYVLFSLVCKQGQDVSSRLCINSIYRWMICSICLIMVEFIQTKPFAKGILIFGTFDWNIFLLQLKASEDQREYSNSEWAVEYKTIFVNFCHFVLFINFTMHVTSLKPLTGYQCENSSKIPHEIATMSRLLS